MLNIVCLVCPTSEQSTPKMTKSTTFSLLKSRLHGISRRAITVWIVQWTGVCLVVASPDMLWLLPDFVCGVTVRQGIIVKQDREADRQAERQTDRLERTRLPRATVCRTWYTCMGSRLAAAHLARSAKSKADGSR